MARRYRDGLIRHPGDKRKVIDSQRDNLQEAVARFESLTNRNAQESYPPFSHCPDNNCAPGINIQTLFLQFVARSSSI